MKLKKLAKRIRQIIIYKNPIFNKSHEILQAVVTQPVRTSSIPMSSILKMISEIYTHILFEYNINNTNSKTKYPIYYYVYNYINSQYKVSKLSESKYRSFIETMLSMKNKYDTNQFEHEKFSTKVLLFCTFITGEFK